MIRTFDELISAVQEKPKRKIAIAAPEGTTVIQLVKKALEEKIAEFILVGEEARVKAMAAEAGVDGSGLSYVNRPDQKAAAEEAVRLVVEGEASAIMKGNLPTATFLRAILNKEKGLNANKVISELTLYEKIEGEGLQMITDCAINIAPNLDEKKQIIENAVWLGHKLGYERPKVAMLSAVEVVNPAIPDTLDAAVLSKMSERGQISGCIVDGPFALDNAISLEAARYKKIEGEVAGRADILMAPNLQVANPLRKSLAFFTTKRLAVAVMGAKAPIIMTSRSDTADTMLLTIALAAYIS